MRRFVLGFFLVTASIWPMCSSAAADLGPRMTGSQWLEFDEARRARLARAAVKVSKPNADRYTAAVHGYDIMRCMDAALAGEAARYAARKNLFVLLRACADASR